MTSDPFNHDNRRFPDTLLEVGRIATPWSLNWVAIGPPLLTLMALIILPGLVLIAVSLNAIAFDTPEAAGQVSIEAYRTVITDPEFWNSLWKSVLFALLTVFIQIILGLVAAISVHLIRPGKASALLTILFFCPYAVPVSACARSWEFLMRENGFYAWLASWVGISPTWWYGQGMFLVLIIASIWQFFPFVFLTTLAQMRRVSPQLYRSAQIDGASKMQQLIHVTFPAIKNTLVSVILLRLAFMFTKFDLPWLLGGNSAVHLSVGVLPVHIYSKISQVGHEAEAAAVLMAVAMAIIGLIAIYLTKLLCTGSLRTRFVARMQTDVCSGWMPILILVSLALATLVFAVFPYLTLLLGSLVPNSSLDKGVGPHTLRALSSINYQTIGDELYRGYGLHLLFTVAISFVTVVAVLWISMLAAYALSRVKYRCHGLLENLALIGYLFPPIVLVISYGTILKASSLNQTVVAVGLAHIAFCLPFGIWLMTRYFEVVPNGFDMAASADGASWWRTLWHILSRRALPGVVAVAMFSFILSWNDVVLSLYLTPQNRQTLPAWIDTLMRTEAASRYGDTAAANALLSSVAIVGFGLLSVWLDNAIRREASV